MKKAPIPIYVLRGHGSEVNSIKFLKSSDVLISGDQNGELRVWDLKSRRTKVQIEKHHSNSILHVDLLSDTLLCRYVNV
jgi:WD40 repeat protein